MTGLSVQALVADEGGGDGGIDGEVFGRTLVSAVQTAEHCQLSHRPLHGPAVTTQPPGGLDQAFR